MYNFLDEILHMNDINNGICLSLASYDNLWVHHVAAYGTICSLLWLNNIIIIYNNINNNIIFHCIHTCTSFISLLIDI